MKICCQSGEAARAADPAGRRPAPYTGYEDHEAQQQAAGGGRQGSAYSQGQSQSVTVKRPTSAQQRLFLTGKPLPGYGGDAMVSTMTSGNEEIYGSDYEPTLVCPRYAHP